MVKAATAKLQERKHVHIWETR